MQYEKMRECPLSAPSLRCCYCCRCRRRGAVVVQVKHLDYDDLNVTQGIREEGLRGGGNRGGRGLDIADARCDSGRARRLSYHGMRST